MDRVLILLFEYANKCTNFTIIYDCMGVIRKQTVSGSFFSYIGVILGFLNLAIISPLIFTTEQIGLPALIIAISVIASQLGSLGFNNVAIRLFPHFRNYQNHHNGFLGLSIIIQSAGLFLVLFAMVFFIPHLIERNSDDISILGEYAYLIIPIIIFQLFFVLFDSFCGVLLNASIGIFLKEFVVRVLNLIIILLFYFGLISFRYYMYLYVLSYGVPAIVLMIYLIVKGEFIIKIDFSFVTRNLRKEIIDVSIYGIMAGLSGLAVSNIDTYFINDYLNLSSVGIYSIAFAFGTLILIPGRAMSKIAAPVIAEFWKEKNQGKILEIYRKSSINQFIGGIAIFMFIWINIDDIINFLPDKYSGGKMVVFFISLANLMTVLSGVSSQVLNTSKSYRYHSYFMFILIVMVIITNMIFIPLWGITGASIATFFSTLVFILIRIVFLYIKFGMHPFELAHGTSLMAGIFLYLAVSAIPFSFPLIINIFVRIALSGSIFLILIYFLRCSADINNEINNIVRRFLRKGRN